MSDLAHVPGQRLQLQQGHSLAEVFAGAIKRAGAAGAPAASKPRSNDHVRSPAELAAVIEEAGVRFEDCEQLSISLDWWNRNSDDAAWEVTGEKRNAATS